MAACIGSTQFPAGTSPAQLRVGYSLATLAPGVVGGAESYARGVLDGIFANQRHSVSLRVIANTTAALAYRARIAGRAELIEVPGRFELGISARAFSMAAMRVRARPLARRVARDLDLVHYPMTVPLPHVYRLPVVQTLQDMQHREHPEWFSRAELAFRRVAYDRGARTATRVITATIHARDQIVAHLGLEPERIDVIGHGIDHERFSPGPDPADEGRLAPLGLPERFLVYPANMWPHKNHDRLVDALALIEDHDVHLVLTGQHYGRVAALRERARRAGVEHRMHHLGHLPFDVLPAVLRRADGMIFPSLFEGFGIPVIEAMACGCPVAASDRSALPEVVAGAGLLFDPADPAAIAEAAHALLTADRDALRRAGRARAEQFSWERCAREHVASYRRALGASPDGEASAAD